MWSVSTIGRGTKVRPGGSFQGRFSEDPVVRYRQKAMHAIAFGSNYTSPFLHATTRVSPDRIIPVIVIGSHRCLMATIVAIGRRSDRAIGYRHRSGH